MIPVFFFHRTGPPLLPPLEEHLRLSIEMSLIWAIHLQAAITFPRPLQIRHRFLDTLAQMQVSQYSASSAELKRRFNSALVIPALFRHK